jgi:hypothetical protein
LPARGPSESVFFQQRVNGADGGRRQPCVIEEDSGPTKGLRNRNSSSRPDAFLKKLPPADIGAHIHRCYKVARLVRVDASTQKKTIHMYGSDGPPPSY